MRALTYVNGILGVIKEGKRYSKKAKKPDFITGTNFYYEPTLKMMDGKPLTKTQISKVENFIDNFIFPDEQSADSKESADSLQSQKTVHCVDKDGNYLGKIVNDGGYQEVPSAPTKETEKWIDGKWVDCVLVDKNTGKYIGIGDTRTSSETKYAPNTVPPNFEKKYYSWDGKNWNISLDVAKRLKKEGIKAKQVVNFNNTFGILAYWEPGSFETQEKEAKAWNSDNSVKTPFIDTLLTIRNLGETKQELVNKILAKADAYRTTFAKMLGKYQSLIKQIDAATTVDEVIQIN